MKLLKKIGNGLRAAVTSPDVVKAEKSVAVMIAARVALSLGASAGFVALIEKLAG